MRWRVSRFLGEKRVVCKNPEDVIGECMLDFEGNVMNLEELFLGKLRFVERLFRFIWSSDAKVMRD